MKGKKIMVSMKPNTQFYFVNSFLSIIYLYDEGHYKNRNQKKPLIFV